MVGLNMIVHFYQTDSFKCSYKWVGYDSIGGSNNRLCSSILIANIKKLGSYRAIQKIIIADDYCQFNIPSPPKKKKMCGENTQKSDNFHNFDQIKLFELK